MHSIPATVPVSMQSVFLKNYQAITKNNKIFLFAVDHKIEHMNQDFFAHNLPLEVNNPERIFKLAQAGNSHALATHLGLISRYGKNYPELNYIVKLNGKTNLIAKSAQDPISKALWSIEHVIQLQQAGINIRGIGYTIYLGSKHEATMLTQAAQLIYQAHQHGLITFLWVYPRGQHVANEHDAHIIAGAAGIANSLGADFVKVQTPKLPNGSIDIQGLTIAVQAAGNTQVICAGGSLQKTEQFLKDLQEQIAIAKTSGIAAGRNIFQLPYQQAVETSQQIEKIVSI